MMVLLLCSPKDSDSRFKRIRLSKPSPQAVPPKFLLLGHFTQAQPLQLQSSCWAGVTWYGTAPLRRRVGIGGTVGYLVGRMFLPNLKKGSTIASICYLLENSVLKE